mmetsp:Transcript_3458/g.3415  ORF Transcript_3458/g.3415 Transcript_3458/m.3415 type:complete len:364 (+) Transcript_3458:635-1726(+)
MGDLYDGDLALVDDDLLPVALIDVADPAPDSPGAGLDLPLLLEGGLVAVFEDAIFDDIDHIGSELLIDDVEPVVMELHFLRLQFNMRLIEELLLDPEDGGVAPLGLQEVHALFLVPVGEHLFLPIVFLLQKAVRAQLGRNHHPLTAHGGGHRPLGHILQPRSLVPQVENLNRLIRVRPSSQNFPSLVLVEVLDEGEVLVELLVLDVEDLEDLLLSEVEGGLLLQHELRVVDRGSPSHHQLRLLLLIKGLLRKRILHVAGVVVSLDALVAVEVVLAGVLAHLEGVVVVVEARHLHVLTVIHQRGIQQLQQPVLLLNISLDGLELVGLLLLHGEHPSNGHLLQVVISQQQQTHRVAVVDEGYVDN